MSTLAVPGATLYYETRGEGPALLLICGGIYDAEGYDALATALAYRYTVITYDRRGNSRSPLDAAPTPQTIQEHADDAYRLLQTVGPAYVFGNSSGALIALELAASHPDHVKAVVAHEPPLFAVLADAAYYEAMAKDVEQAFASDGPEAAMGVFAGALGMTQQEEQAEPSPEAMGRMMANIPQFIGYEVPPFTRYSPDLDALRRHPRIVLAAGTTSTGEAPNQAALALAAELGTEPLILPGDHGGFGAHADAFATSLAKLFS